MVEMDALRRVSHIIDKPQQTKLEYMWGCIVWRPQFTEHLHECIAENRTADFAQIMNAAMLTGLRFGGICIDGSYSDLGTYDEIVDLERRFRAE